MVTECVRRGWANTAFGTAMDDLLRPEIRALRSDTPDQILGANSALSNTPGLRFMLSQRGHDGSVTLTDDTPKTLFAQEMQLMHQIIRTNLSVQMEILGTQTDLPAYLANAPLIAANVAREGAVKQGQKERLAGANASAQLLIQLISRQQPDVAGNLKTIATAVHDIGEAMDALEASSKILKAAGAGGLAAAGLPGTSFPGGAVAISAGWNHNLALKANGTAVGWGANSDGRANGAAAGGNIIAIATGVHHSLALKADGTVTGLGSNASNQRDLPAHDLDGLKRHTPRPVLRADLEQTERGEVETTSRAIRAIATRR
jgi:hypothetical protein